ncbi:ester cyclase [Streptomyces griseoaurantiacus]|uniref:ester cyclase n=1 Tax=Streptomyces griseoaurantiacus TaxID=68213 RepID=UPI00379BDA34
MADTEHDLESHYRAYLRALNERRLDDLVHFVRDTLTYNGEPMERRRYRDMIATDIAAVPDLRFDVGLLVVSADQVACRLVFDCTPRHEFLGFVPDGGRVSFAEHVFYTFEDGRIATVWSLIDRDALARRLRRVSEG